MGERKGGYEQDKSSANFVIFCRLHHLTIMSLIHIRAVEIGAFLIVIIWFVFETIDRKN